MKQKGFANIVLVVVLIVVLAGVVGYFVLVKKSEPVPQTPTKTNDVKTRSILDITGWEVYKNDKYGFEVKYPPDDFIVFNDSPSSKDPNYMFFLAFIEYKYKEDAAASKPFPDVYLNAFRRGNLTNEEYIQNRMKTKTDEFSKEPLALKERIDMTNNSYQLVFGDGSVGGFYVIQDNIVYEVKWHGSKEYKDVAGEIFNSLKIYMTTGKVPFKNVSAPLSIEIESRDKTSGVVYGKMSLKIPEGDLPIDTNLRVSATAQLEYYDPSIGGVYYISPKDLVLATPATVSITYTDNAITLRKKVCPNFRESDLILVYFDKNENKYKSIESNFDLSTRTVTGRIFKLYGDGIWIAEPSILIKQTLLPC